MYGALATHAFRQPAGRVSRQSTALLFLLLAFYLPPGGSPIALGEQAAAGSERRPNILFCFADDWGRYASAYREGDRDATPNAVVRTPNFDRIASEGVLFNRAFVNAPSCTPCRSSLLSGQQFYRTGLGAILQGAIWDAAIPSYPLLLRDSGYHIGHTYKVWSPGTPANAPYGAARYAYNRRGGRMNRFSQAVSQSQDAPATIAEILGEVRGNFQDFLAARKPGQPFCYWFGPTNCHRVWVRGSGQKIWGLDPDRLRGKLPPFLPDNEVVREDFNDYLGEVQAFDAAVGELLAELRQSGELENTLVVVSGDHGAPGFPRGKCNLYDFGVQVALAVRWGSQIPAGRTVDDLVSLPDLAPTFLEAAGLQPPAVMTARSLLPLLRSGKSGQVEPQRDHVIVGRERHVAAARPGQLPYPQRAIRTQDFLYIRNFRPDRWPMGTAPGFGQDEGQMPDFATLRDRTFAAFGDLDASPTKAWLLTHRTDPGMARYVELAVGRRPAEELYDLRQDPHQVDNVAADPEYADRKEQLAERLLSYLRQTGDPRVSGDGSTFERPPYAGK